MRGNHGELHLLTNLSWSSNTNEIFSQMNARTGVPCSVMRLLLGQKAIDIVIYDSKYSSLSQRTQTLIAKLVNTDKPSFTVRVASVTKQSGASDCGLYAIAYITHIATGLNPSLYIFRQALMRNHLLKCFEQKKLEPFPVFKERRVSTCAKKLQSRFTAIAALSMMVRKWWSAMVDVENGISTPVHKNKKWFCKNCRMI